MTVSESRNAHGVDAVPRPWRSGEATRRWPWLLAADTVDELVRARARTTPNDLFLVDEADHRMTFGEFDQTVSRAAAALAAAGVTEGTRVAWQLPTRVSTVLVIAALRRLGAVQAPIIPAYRERETGAALAAADAQVFLVPGTWRGFDHAAMAARIAAGGGPSPRILEIGSTAPEAPGPSVTAPADAEAVRWIHFTSGSTGVPRGARHTDSTLLTAAAAFAGIGELGRRPGEFGSIGFPLAHVGGAVYLLAALACGMPVLLLETFVPDRAVELYNRYGVTTAGGAPVFYQALLDAAAARPAGQRGPIVPTLRTLMGGGAPCAGHLVMEVADRLGAVLAHDYGMTEVPMVAVAAPGDPPEILAASDGRPIPGNQIRLVPPGQNADGMPAAGAEAPADGEVQVRGAGVCRGYTDPAATASAFTADGWFRTGDLGRLLPSGHIEVIGRIKELIIRKGENIAPREIEELLGRHPDVAEAAVLGLPDLERGERVCAVVVPKPGRTAPTLTGLTTWLSGAGLMRQKLPEQLEVVDALPRTGLGKVARQQLRERFGRRPG